MYVCAWLYEGSSVSLTVVFSFLVEFVRCGCTTVDATLWHRHSRNNMWVSFGWKCARAWCLIVYICLMDAFCIYLPWYSNDDAIILLLVQPISIEALRGLCWSQGVCTEVRSTSWRLHTRGIYMEKYIRVPVCRQLKRTSTYMFLHLFLR